MCLRDAYSRDIVVRVSVLSVVSGAGGGRLVPPEGTRDGPRERALDGLVRSMVGEGTRPPSMAGLCVGSRL